MKGENKSKEVRHLKNVKAKENLITETDMNKTEHSNLCCSFMVMNRSGLFKSMMLLARGLPNLHNSNVKENFSLLPCFF